MEVIKELNMLVWNQRKLAMRETKFLWIMFLSIVLVSIFCCMYIYNTMPETTSVIIMGIVCFIFYAGFFAWLVYDYQHEYNEDTKVGLRITYLKRKLFEEKQEGSNDE